MIGACYNMEYMENPPPVQPPPARRWVWIAVVLAVLVVVIVVAALIALNRPARESAPSTDKTASTSTSTSPNASENWQEQGVAIAGKYADADAVSLGDNQYRLYYAVEPEVQGNKMEVFSATSTDGITWTPESGTRRTFAAFPDVLQLKDGTWRMYFQDNQAGGIRSATSTDGLTFTDEPGLRLDTNEPEFNLDTVGAQSTTLLPDGTYVMVYRGTINEPYQTTEKIPNQNTQLYFWATSKDGLEFERQGTAIDSRNDTLYGLTDGADFVRWDDNTLRVYFWSYTGVYYTTFVNNTFTEPVFTFTNHPGANQRFSPDPPGDPTLIKINGGWKMFYGQHTKGIYYATLANGSD